MVFSMAREAREEDDATDLDCRIIRKEDRPGQTMTQTAVPRLGHGADHALDRKTVAKCRSTVNLDIASKTRIAMHLSEDLGTPDATPVRFDPGSAA